MADDNSSLARAAALISAAMGRSLEKLGGGRRSSSPSFRSFGEFFPNDEYNAANPMENELLAKMWTEAPAPQQAVPTEYVSAAPAAPKRDEKLEWMNRYLEKEMDRDDLKRNATQGMPKPGPRIRLR